MRKHLYKHNLHKPLHHSFDQDFFLKETEQAYYWAGFIAADGCVDHKTLRIGIIDIDHLKQFKSDIKATQQIRIIPPRQSIVYGKKVNNKETGIIAITSVKMLKDLLDKFNIGPRKSLTYSVPENLLNSPLAKHFMRGLIDGDGSWYIVNVKPDRKQIRLSLVGTKNCCESLRKLFVINNMYKESHSLKERKNCWEVTFQSHNDLLKVRDFLYRDATVFLERKFKIASQIEDFIKRYSFAPILELEKLLIEVKNISKIARILNKSRGQIYYAIKQQNLTHLL
jgi:hypothetical protein